LHTKVHTHTPTHTITLNQNHGLHLATDWTDGTNTHTGSWDRFVKTVNGERQEDTNTEFYSLGCINKQK